MANKWVYLFTEGKADMRNLLGGKGANLAEMTNIGLPVPQGFTITTEAEIRRFGESLTCFGTFRCKSFHARYDGYNSEPRIKRRCCKCNR